MNILIVGFGNIGCRHTQSILNSKIKATIWVIEPSEEIFKINSERIGAITGQLNHLKQIEELSVSIDFAIVATSAKPRFEVVKKLLNIGIKKLLVEKVVFQSEAQFEEIIRLLEQNDAKAYCNFVNRYFDRYKLLHNNLDKIITMTVIGGDFGLGCNALHYVDLFEYLTNQPANLNKYALNKDERPNKRGVEFKEVLGQLYWVTERGDRLLISSELSYKGPINTTIIQADNIICISEDNQIKVEFSPTNGLVFDNAKTIYTSSLTSVIINDIFNNTLLLPSIQETKNCHTQFFNAINETLSLNKNDLCPIT